MIELDEVAEIVHQAYLDACRRLDWYVRPENNVPYDQLSEQSKEIDRAVARAILNRLKITYYD